jgi:hypothetical protein
MGRMKSSHLGKAFRRFYGTSKDGHGRPCGHGNEKILQLKLDRLFSQRK